MDSVEVSRWQRDGFEVCAIRNIQPGAEILVDYGKDWAGD